MKILGLIPARGGSKGIPGKNLKMLWGKPLLLHTIEVAAQCSLINTLCLSSDDDAIIELGKKSGVETPFKRPIDLAQDSTPTLPVIQHAIQYYENQQKHFDAVCLLQATSPTRTLQDLENAITQFKLTKADSLVSVIEVPHHFNPHWVFETTDNKFLKLATGEQEIIAQRQALPKAYIRDGAIFLTKTEVLMNCNSLYGEKIAYVVFDPHRYLDLDTVEDWEYAERKFSGIQK